MCIPIYLWQPLATCFVGLMVAFIAFYQMKVAHDKLRLDLYDRRYKIYQATKKFVVMTLKANDYSYSQMFEFYADTTDAVFLFDSDVVDYLKQIEKRVIESRRIYDSFQPLPVGVERTRLCDEEQSHRLWLTDQITAMTKTFTPYLGFSNIKGTFSEELINRNH
jgi:hypothetical protein